MYGIIEFTYNPSIGKRGGCCDGVCCACPSSGPCAVAAAGTSRTLICKNTVCSTGPTCGCAPYACWVL